MAIWHQQIPFRRFLIRRVAILSVVLGTRGRLGYDRLRADATTQKGGVKRRLHHHQT
jgi:hypothetical protein